MLGSFLFSGASWLQQFFVVTPENQSDIINGIRMLPLLFIPYIINITNINYYRIDRRGKSAVSVVFLEALFTIIIVVPGLEYYNFGIPEVILGLMVARLIVSILFIKTVLKYINWSGFSMKILKRLWLFSWPFFVISASAWVTLSIDKFIGADVLTNKDDIAVLALSMQLCLPIVVIADMIRTTIGPFIMSIKNDENANQTYQQVFDLSVFSSLTVLVSIVIATPLLTYVLADETYMKSIMVIPLIAFSNVLSMISNQFSISFSLVKKNSHLIFPTVAAGLIVIIGNIFFMKEYGFVVSGVSQALAGIIMAAVLYIIGRQVTDLKINLKNSSYFMLITSAFITAVYIDMESILKGSYFTLFFGGTTCLMFLAFVYLITYKKSKA
jgi:O-antigen/teichoic acid export membrane protein